MRIKEFYADNIDLGTVALHITLEPMQEALKYAETVNSLVGEEVDLEAKKHRQKRSLSANSYFYLLCGKIADATDTSKPEIHNRMLCRYGQYMRDGNGNIVFCLYPASIDYMKDEEVHLKPTGHMESRNGLEYEWFAVMRGSHDLNTQEMAKLIDGVVSECKELGIETMTPDEISRLENTA